MSLRQSLAGLVLIVVFSTLIFLNNQRSQDAHQKPGNTQTETTQASSTEQADNSSPATVESRLVSGSKESEEPGPNEVELYGENSIDTSVILDEFEIAIWMNARRLLESDVVERFLTLASEDAPTGTDPLTSLERDLGVDPSLIESALFLAAIPDLPDTPSAEQYREEIEVIEGLQDQNEGDIEGDFALPVETQTQASTDDSAPSQPDIIDPPVTSAEPEVEYGAVISFTKAVDLSGVAEKITTSRNFDYVDNQLISNHIAGTEADYNGKTYIRGANGKPSVFIKDDKTLLVASEEQLHAMMIGQGGGNDLAAMVGKIEGDNTFVFAANVEESPAALSKVNLKGMGMAGQFLQVLELAKKAETFLLAINPDSDTPIYLQLAGREEKDSKDIFLQLNSLATLAKVMLPAQVQQFQSNPNVDAATLGALTAATELAKNLSVKNDNNIVTVTLTWNTTLRNQLLNLVTVAAGKARSAARKAQSNNNMKQIGLAIYNYEFTYENFPAGEKDNIKYADGKPLLSWRVHILPFIEQQALYDQFKLDQPWNSEHNIKLLDQMPLIYKHPEYEELENKTVYRVPSSDGSVLGEHKLIGIEDVTDGTSSTAMVLAVGPDKAIEWTKPGPLPIDVDDVTSSFGTLQKVIIVLFADGAVRDIPLSMENDDWLKLLNRHDGEVLELSR